MSAPVQVLVPISGGKDSQACLELALTFHPKEGVRGLFCDTQFEHPLTYAHIDWMARHYGIRIDRVCEGSVPEKVLRYGRFPSGIARFCTDELKIRPTRKYMRALAIEQGSGFEAWYGMRSKESNEREKRYAGKLGNEVYQPHEVLPGKYPQYLGRMGVRFRLAVLDWTGADVLSFLGGRENPLYSAGMPRVGCFPCLASGDKSKELAFNYDATGGAHHEVAKTLSLVIGKPIWMSKGGNSRNCELHCSD